MAFAQDDPDEGEEIELRTGPKLGNNPGPSHGENQAAGCKFHSGTADREDARLTADSSPAGTREA